MILSGLDINKHIRESISRIIDLSIIIVVGSSYTTDKDLRLEIFFYKTKFYHYFLQIIRDHSKISGPKERVSGALDEVHVKSSMKICN